jgi:hypothetical protein
VTDNGKHRILRVPGAWILGGLACALGCTGNIESGEAEPIEPLGPSRGLDAGTLEADSGETAAPGRDSGWQDAGLVGGFDDRPDTGAPSGDGGTTAPEDSGADASLSATDAGGDSTDGPIDPADHSPSPVVSEVRFNLSTMESAAPGSDNWAITWADDGHQYAAWGDGGGFGGTNTAGRVSLGFARIEGGASSYRGYNVWGGYATENPATFDGKAYGLISVGGSLYALVCPGSNTRHLQSNQHVYRSNDHGASWSHADWTFAAGTIFCPTFLQFGRDYAGARDEYVYVYGPEVQDDASWDVQFPGEIALSRVPRERIMDRSAWEFFTGTNSRGAPTWSSRFADREPVFIDAENGVMRTSVIYVPGLDRYILMTQQVSRLRSEGGMIGIYDAPDPWGPWSRVLLDSPWSLGIADGTKTVFYNLSPKWLSSDGRDFVMVFTGPGADEWGTVRGHFVLR